MKSISEIFTSNAAAFQRFLVCVLAMAAMLHLNFLAAQAPAKPAPPPKITIPKTIEPTDTPPAPKVKASDLQKKDLWLAVGLSLGVAGLGHAYLGKLDTGAIMFVGTVGFLGVGIALILTSFQSRTQRVDGQIAQVESDTNEPLLLVGSLCFASGVLFYLGNIVSIFVQTRDHNRRIDRIKRYQKRLMEKQATGINFDMYAHSEQGGFVVGGSVRKAVF